MSTSARCWVNDKELQLCLVGLARGGLTRRE
jgi:hypothetical protein